MTTDDGKSASKNFGFGETASVMKYCKYYTIASVPVSVTSVGYATFSSTYNLDFSGVEDIEACTASVDEKGKIAYTVVNTVAAGEGVLLRSKAGGEASVNVPVLASATANGDNAFVAITSTQQLAQTETEGTDTYTRYILSKVDEEVGFYKVNAKGSWMKEGTAYLKVKNAVGGTAPMRSFFPLWGDGDDATAIKDAESEKAENGAMYNLAGQRVGKDYKGIVVVNGKKFMNK